MAAIVSVTDGVDDILATHLNQYAQTFNNLLGITDSAQANLGRLPVPWLGADPATANGLVWFRSDLGTSGRMRKRLNGYSSDHMGVRQRLEANQNPIYVYNPTISNGANDVPGCIINNLNTSGGRLRIWVFGQNGTAGQIYGLINSSSAATWSVSVYAQTNTALQIPLTNDFILPQGPTMTFQRNWGISAVTDWLPAAPLVAASIKLVVSFNLQPSAASISINALRLVVEELDD